MYESPDLFARVEISIEDDRRLRGQHRALVVIGSCIAAALAAITVGVIDRREGELLMDWWILEIITTVVLVAIAFWLGPLIKRFGRSYAADVFRANPRTGKSFIMLTDVAYYLIFFSYILFTVSFEPRASWSDTVTAAQLQHETARIAGILLIIGVLHSVNLLALPVMGRLLTLNRRLDEVGPDRPPGLSGTRAPRARRGAHCSPWRHGAADDDGTRAVRLRAEPAGEPRLDIPTIDRLDDGDVLTIAVTGGVRFARGVVRQCTATAVGFENCTNSFPVQFGDDGDATFQYRLRDPGGCDGTTACVVVVGDRDGVRLAEVATVFGGTAPPSPTVVLSPSGPLEPGQRVRVDISSLPAGARTSAAFCGSSCGPATAAVADAAGTATITVVVGERCRDCGVVVVDGIRRTLVAAPLRGRAVRALRPRPPGRRARRRRRSSCCWRGGRSPPSTGGRRRRR